MLRIGYNQAEKKLGFLLPENQMKRREEVYLKSVTCFIVDKTTGDVLLEKRTSNVLNAYSYDLVSGHVDGDEIGLQAMIRELKEEIGIGIEESSINLKKLKEFTPMHFENIGKYFVEFYCLLRSSKDGLEIDENEIDHIEWKPMEEVFRMIKDGETKAPKDFDYEPIFQKVREIYQGKQKENIVKEEDAQK